MPLHKSLLGNQTFQSFSSYFMLSLLVRMFVVDFYLHFAQFLSIFVCMSRRFKELEQVKTSLYYWQEFVWWYNLSYYGISFHDNSNILIYFLNWFLMSSLWKRSTTKFFSMLVFQRFGSLTTLETLLSVLFY